MLLLIWLIGIALMSAGYGVHRAYTMTSFDERGVWIIALWPLTLPLLCLYWFGCGFFKVGEWIGEWRRIKRAGGE